MLDFGFVEWLRLLWALFVEVTTGTTRVIGRASSILLDTGSSSLPSVDFVVRRGIDLEALSTSGIFVAALGRRDRLAVLALGATLSDPLLTAEAIAFICAVLVAI